MSLFNLCFCVKSVRNLCIFIHFNFQIRMRDCVPETPNKAVPRAAAAKKLKIARATKMHQSSWLHAEHANRVVCNVGALPNALYSG